MTEEVTTTFTHDGRRFVALAMPILSEALPWTIGVYAPEDDFIAEIKQNRLINIWIAVAVAAVTGGSGWRWPIQSIAPCAPSPCGPR